MVEVRELTQAVYNLIAPKLEGVPANQLSEKFSEAVKDELSHCWLYERGLLKPFLIEFGGNKSSLADFLTQQYLQPTTIPPQPITVLTRADRVNYLFTEVLTTEQRQQAVASLDDYWLFRTASELGHVTTLRKLFKRLGVSATAENYGLAEHILLDLRPPITVGRVAYHLRKERAEPSFAKFIATEDIDRATYAIKSNRKSLSAKPPAAAVVSRPIITPDVITLDANKVLAAPPRDFYRISEESKIGDFRDHVAQEPGLYLAAWHDKDISSLLRFRDKAVVDAFWDNYYGNVLLAVRELIKSCQFPNLTFEAAYREINTVLADIYQIVKDEKNEQTDHGDNGNPQSEVLMDDDRVVTTMCNNGSLTKRGLKEEIEPAVIVRAKMGDHAAFERIVQHYWGPIYNLVNRMMGNPEDSFDFTQDTFMKAYCALPRTSDDLRLGSWIYRIATNNCLDELRHRKRIHLLPWESFISVFHPSQISRDNPVRDVLDGENQEEIQAILDRLHPKYRAGLILRHYHDFSYDEIAEALNTTRAAVKSLLFRAREEFRQVYARTERRPALQAA